MGIRGLHTFMNDSFCFERKPIQGRIVIDGNNFCHCFYHDENIDWVNGGQYSSFKEVLLQFFRSLKASRVEPVVVFDGIDHKREKESTVLKKKGNTVREMRGQLRQLTDGNPLSYRVIPVLARDVLREVIELEEFSIPTYTVDGEADPVAVAVANHYQCPIVANDSDYYIFNIENGYIPLNRFNWQSQPVTADLYTLRRFDADFKFKDPQLSRMIPAILGNDLINGSFGNTYLKEDIFSTSRYGVSRSKRLTPVQSVVRYIAKFETVSDLLEHVSALQTGNSIARALSKDLEKAKQTYNTTSTLSEKDLMKTTVLTTTNDSKLPEWILHQYRRGNFFSGLMEVLVVGRSFLPLVTDDPDKPTAHEASHPIRQSIYGILSPLMKGDSVTEVIRVEDKLCERKVTCSPSAVVPSFPAIEELFPEVKQRVDVLCEVIEIDPAVLKTFDEKWKLVVAAGCFWARKCSPRPSLELVKSLVLCMVICSSGRDPSSLLPSQDPKVGNKQWMNALHEYSRFQCVYLDIMKLNNILQNPLLILSPANFFDGKLVQYFACLEDIDEITSKERSSPLYGNLLNALWD